MHKYHPSRERKGFHYMDGIYYKPYIRWDVLDTSSINSVVVLKSLVLKGNS